MAEPEDWPEPVVGPVGLVALQAAAISNGVTAQTGTPNGLRPDRYPMSPGYRGPSLPRRPQYRLSADAVTAEFATVSDIFGKAVERRQPPGADRAAVRRICDAIQKLMASRQDFFAASDYLWGDRSRGLFHTGRS